MRRHQSGDVVWLSHDLFYRRRGVTNVVSTRLGGVSRKRYHALNLGLRVGDDEVAVLENRAILCRAAAIDPLAVVTARQVHGTRVAVVTAAERGRGAVSSAESIPATDALVTGDADVPLMIITADCVAVSLYDPRRHAAGIAHASWRGTLGRIAQKTIRVMEERFGTDPAHLLAAIGPSIGPCCYEVGSDVVEPFREEFPGEARSILASPRTGKYHLDLWTANELQLLEAGVAPSNLERADLCTGCRTDLFYSYRKEKKKTGHMGTILMLHADG